MTGNWTHQQKVEQIKRILLDLNLPVLPLNTVKSRFYTPDIVTRVNNKFIPIDFINSKNQLNFDIGGLIIVSGKDICEFALAVISDSLWNRYLHDFRKLKLNLPPRLTVIPFKEVKNYFAQLC